MSAPARTISKLLTPLTIRSVTLRNRLGMSPMCMYSSKDGFIHETFHAAHIGARALGGLGLISIEATAVSPVGRISPSDLGVWSDKHIPGLQTLAKLIREYGAVACIQIAHAGRKASTYEPMKGNGRAVISISDGGWKPVAPSAIPFDEHHAVPEPLTTQQIDEIIEEFAAAARRAFQAGFQIIEIHAAHGYLLHEFLSPLSNKRTDNYGGSFENRTRIVRQVAAAVRKATPAELPVFIRVSCTDWAEGGWTEADTIALAKQLKQDGSVDLIDCSSGALIGNIDYNPKPLYQVPFAEHIRADAGIPTAAVGAITTASQAHEIVENGRADVVLLGRQLLRDPFFAVHAAEELGVKFMSPESANVPWCRQYGFAVAKR